MDKTKLTLGVPKGRLAKAATEQFRQVGIDISAAPQDARAMILPTNKPDLQTCAIRSKDVGLLLESKVLDMAVIGSDVLYEASTLSFGQRIDLGICKCRMSLIGLPGTPTDFTDGQRVSVATKYPRATQTYFAQFGIEPEIITLNGSTELAPLTGLARYVVDIVSTGETLARNKLVELDHVADVSAWALVSRHVLGERRARCARYLRALRHRDDFIPHFAANVSMPASITHA